MAAVHGVTAGTTDRTGVTRLALALLAIWLVHAVVLLVPGEFALSALEGDTLHAIDGISRVAMGQSPHVDFMTPLGVLAFEPVAIPMRLGVGVGMSMLIANLIIAALTIPATLWLRATRLGFGLSLAIGWVAIVFASALIFETASRGSTFGMYYNRWCWAFFVLGFAILAVPPRGRADLGDAVALGAISALMFHIKITYFAVFAPMVIVHMIAFRRWRMGFGAIAIGLGLIAAVALANGGVEHLVKYAGDLATVALSDIRPKPGAAFGALLTSPSIAPVTLGMAVSILLLIRARQGRSAWVWAAGGIAVFAVAYQNWGNAVAGAVAAPVALAALAARTPPAAKAFGVSAAQTMRLAAFGFLVHFSPMLMNMETSVFWSWGAGGGKYEPTFADFGIDDIAFEAEGDQLYGMSRVSAADGAADDDSAMAAGGSAAEAAGDGAEDAEKRKWRDFAGVRFPDCNSNKGYIASYAEGARFLRGLPEADGATVLSADYINALWLLAGEPPQRGAHIWYYGKMRPSVIQTTDILMVPVCPPGVEPRNAMIDEIADSGVAFRKIGASRYWVAFERADRQAGVSK